MLLNCIRLKVKKILGKNQNEFKRNWSTSLTLTIGRIIERVRIKNLEATHFFIDFSNGSLTRWWHQVLWNCHRSRAGEYINTISIYKLSSLCTKNVHWSNEKIVLHERKKKARSRRYPTNHNGCSSHKYTSSSRCIQAFHTNTPAQAGLLQALQQSLKQAASCIDLLREFR